MDCCYPLSTARFIAYWCAIKEGMTHTNAISASTPVVEEASAVPLAKDARIDGRIEAHLNFPLVSGGIKATTVGCLKGGMLEMEFSLKITGEHGTLTVSNFVAPFFWHSCTFKKTDGTTKSTSVYGEDGQSTYFYQMKAFLRVIREVNADSVSLSAELTKAGLTPIEVRIDV